MKNLLISITLALLLGLLTTLTAAAQEPPPKGPEPLPTPPGQSADAPTGGLLQKIEPQLLKELLAADGEPVPFIVYMRQTANVTAALSAAGQSLTAQADPVLARRQALVQELQQTAQRSQTGVLQLLTGSGPAGQSVSNVRSLWIINGVAAQGSLNTVAALAARPEVEIVRLDETIRLNRPAPKAVSKLLVPHRSPEWGISKIRADVVQDALGFDGSGIVVANIDSGVDWLHPDLQTQYRGYNGAGKLPDHGPNWHDTTGNGATYPVDSDSHGTHTMGTMVAKNGLGVAPGAQWIAVRAFQGNSALNSWLHDAFQWVLAPNGNPALAPHIVNNSWGSTNGFSTEFEEDIELLLAAGILPVISAGNNGPFAGTVSSPGSLDNAFSVGATDINDDIANFSGRGPSPWGQIKPEVSAPGVDVRSTLPGGAYGNFNGTSMAAPHVSGLAALIMQAEPALINDPAGVIDIIKNTAVPLGDPIPNNNFGVGRIDAYNAVMAVTAAGELAGKVGNAATGQGIANATLHITPSLGGPAISLKTNATGSYTQGLAAGIYDVTASAFGYLSQSVEKLNIVTGTTAVQNFSLTPLPAGTLAGNVIDQSSGQPLEATIFVDDTPVSTTTVNGAYSLTLPTGSYTIRAVATAHRVGTAGITINKNATTTQNFALAAAPTILLVDSGRWYQSSEIGYYRQALNEALYSYDEWQILAPFQTPSDVPTLENLQPYEVVIWSSPLDSPGYVEAGPVLQDYLDGGGKLLLSGQDVAYLDEFNSEPYLRNWLHVDFVDETDQAPPLTGATGGPFAGLSLSISGGEGADNQEHPDWLAGRNPDLTNPLLWYDLPAVDAPLAGLSVGQCAPYRAMFFGFGLEGISSTSQRSELLERALTWFESDLPAVELRVTAAEETKIGSAGSVVSHTLRIRNNGRTTDTVSLTIDQLGPYNWPSATPLPATASVGPCSATMLTFSVQIPANVSWHISDTLTVRATSGNDPAVTQIITRHTKTPAPLLLVDDDRWYSFSQQYRQALSATNIPYDYWYVPKSWSGPVPPSPPLETLRMYPLTLWYTAYDWFQPLTIPEEERLMAYLDGGGRLLFSSQDFLYRHLLQHGEYGPFVRDYLGVQTHTEDFSSTLTIGVDENPATAWLGPYPLTFPAGYRNWTDALSPTAGAAPATVGQHQRPNSITHGGYGPGDRRWRTHFFAYGPELLDDNDRTRLLQRSLGNLSWLGDSTISVEVPAITEGTILTYSVVISNNGRQLIDPAYFTATFPAYLQPLDKSPALSEQNGAFVWQGSLAPGQQQQLVYTAQISESLPPGSAISQSSWLAYPQHNILFDRVTGVKLLPDLTGSTMNVTPTQGLEVGDVLTYTITLKNGGWVDAALITTTDTLPNQLSLLGVDSWESGTVAGHAGGFTWTTALAKDGTTSLTFRARLSDTYGSKVRNRALVENNNGQQTTLIADAGLKLENLYLPVITKN